MKPIVKFFGDIILNIWCWWSNYRFKDVERFSREVEPDDKVHTMTEIYYLMKKLYSCFIWTADGIDQFGDAVTPPPQNYKTYLNQPLKDDCDGFHSLLYHCLFNSGYRCYLLTVNTLKTGHCVLLMQDKDLGWYVLDYTKIYKRCETPQKAIDDYAAAYPKVYKDSRPVVYTGLVSYDYKEGKFYRQEISKVEE